MDTSQYLEIFLDETKEHLQNLNTSILELESEPENENTINEIFRAAHSLKGMAGTMGYKRMQDLTHNMENVFSEVRNGSIKIKSEMIDILFQCLDALEEYTDNIQNTQDEGTNDNEPIIKSLKAIIDSKGESVGEAAAPAKEEAKASESKSDDASAGGTKWDNVKLDESQMDVLEEAKKQGKNVFGMNVEIQEGCILKAARAFLVIKAIEELGEIAVSDPPTQDLEDEKFDMDFTLMVVTDNSMDDLVNAAKAVSEIGNVTAGEFIPDNNVSFKKEEATAAPKEEAKAPETTAPAPTTTAPTAKAAPAGDKAQGGKAEPKKAGKPVVNRTIRVDIEKLDNMMNLVSELIIAKNSLVSATNAANAAAGTNSTNEQIEYLESVTTNLHESVMKVRMVPIESVVSKFPRMIRDLQKTLGKKMELFMTGEDTELDRTVVDEIGDPLMHLLRNSADHGLESAEVRKERGKPEVGSIFLDAYQEGNNVIIEVRDDGNGIDVEAVKAKAIERGVITPEQGAIMPDKDIINLLFNAGFSTAKQVTDISGRGVGLDVVRSKIESLSGEVSVKSELGVGSTWTIRLPLTLAIIQSLMVVVGGEKYAISLGSIETIETIEPGEVKLVQNEEVINLRGNVLPLIRLNQILENESTIGPDDAMCVVIVKKGDKMAGLVIDELIGQMEIVIKPLGKYIKQAKVISGATILGDGEVALILDTNVMF
ncbi:MAG: chemotaxis protein CheA [Lachnospiraceae bacterium]|nr:chemotaxis protein CheA [Lachnospiraceae bacterium]